MQADCLFCFIVDGEEKRRVAINNAKRQWDAIQGSLMSRTGKITKMPELYAQHVVSYSSNHGPESSIQLLSGIGHSKEASTIDDVFHLTGNSRIEKHSKRPESAHSVPTEISVPTNLTEGCPKLDIAKSSSAKTRSEQLKTTKETLIFRSPGNVGSGMCELNNLAELDDNSLSMYGLGSLEALDRNWGIQAAGAVSTVAFNFIDFDEITKHLHKLRSRFPSLACLVLNACNIHNMAQLNGLATVRRLDHLVIDQANPVTKFSLWKYYLLFRLAHFSLKTINNEEVTATDIVHAEQLFGTLSHVMTSELTFSQLISLLGESKKKQVLSTMEEKGKKTSETKFFEKSQEELVGRSTLMYPGSECVQTRQQKSQSKKRLSKSYVAEIAQDVLHADKKRCEVAKIWPQLFQELLVTIISDMNDIQTYKKNWLEKLEKSF